MDNTKKTKTNYYRNHKIYNHVLTCLNIIIAFGMSAAQQKKKSSVVNENLLFKSFQMKTVADVSKISSKIVYKKT